MRSLLIYHFIPFAISVIIVGGLLWFVSALNIKPSSIEPEKKVISGDYEPSRGFTPNLNNDKKQIKLYSSIQQNDLIIFGSSEFNGSVYCPFNFLPDSLNIPTFGVGHAFHQSLSILIECLAFSDEIKGKKINIILSPGWFESDGTNTNAFIEFANTNFLNRIILNESIDEKYKLHIGKYIFNNSNNIDNLSYQMDYLKGLFQNQSKLSLGNLNSKLNKEISDVIPVSYSFDTIEYSLEKPDLEARKVRRNFNYKTLSNNLQSKFITSVTNNEFFVNNEYYETYLKNSSKKYIEPMNLENKELMDFELLVNFLSEKKVKLSVVMQPLNPYYYENLEAINPIINKISKVMEKNKIPFLNLYSNNEKSYEPGTLRDVMHFGDYGWLKVSQFLDSLYHE